MFSFELAMAYNGLLNSRSACVAPAAGILAFNCCLSVTGHQFFVLARS